MRKNQYTGFKRSLHIQSRVIGALLMREILTRFGRHNIGFLWLFAEPMIFTLAVASFWALIGGKHYSSMPIIAFAVTGYSSVLVWRNTVNRCSLAITPNLSLMYHRNVRIIDIFVARILLEVAGATISFIVLSFIFISIGMMAPPVDIFVVLSGWILLIWFGASLAIMIGSLTERSEIVEKIWHPISYLLFPLSGAAFMVDWLPSYAQKLIILLPMVNGVEILREGFFGSTIHAHYDVGYTVIICMIQTLFALVFCQEAAKNVEPE
jgi:capsular polysaccharide transport system permease protein